MSPARTPVRRVGSPTTHSFVSSERGVGCRRSVRRRASRGLMAALIAVSGCAHAEAPAEPSAAVAPVDLAPARVQVSRPHPGRIVAVGDLHGDLGASLKVLSMAGIVDVEGHWAGGRTILIQTGDTTDRGPDSKQIIELLIRLSGEAEADGGQVVALLGNHEVMNMAGDWRYVHPGDVAAFGSPEARRAAFAPTGPQGAWLRGRDVVARVGDTVFVHGGVSPTWAARGLDTINRTARVAIDADPRAAVLGAEGPLWLRDYLQAPESIACPMLAEALQLLGAVRMVVGHTTQRTGRVADRCNGALLGIDTGISGHYGGNLAAVQIEAGKATALYTSGPVDLPDPSAPTK